MPKYRGSRPEISLFGEELPSPKRLLHIQALLMHIHAIMLDSSSIHRYPNGDKTQGEIS